MFQYSIQQLKSDILYEDGDLLVFHKPAGLAVQSKSLYDRDLQSYLRLYLKGGYLGIIHRIDQPVEGILLFGKTPASTAKLSEQIRERGAGKQYLAVVTPSTEEGKALLDKEGPQRLEDYLLKERHDNQSWVVPEGTAGAKKSDLTFQTLCQKEIPLEDSTGTKTYPCALLQVHLGTGRHHQIRVQLSHAGLPIVADQRYGVPVDGDLALCAAALSFVHPRTGEDCTYRIRPSGKIFLPFADAFPW